MRCRHQFLPIQLIKRAQHQPYGRGVINRAKGAAAGGAEGAVGYGGGAPGGGFGGPFHRIAREFHPGGGECAGMALAHFARTGVRFESWALRLKADFTAQAAAGIGFRFGHVVLA